LTVTAIVFVSWVIWIHSSISHPSSWSLLFPLVSRFCSTTVHSANGVVQWFVQ
jgi:hypothetical protein